MRDAGPVVWITGAGGLLGHYLVRTAARCVPTWRVVGLTRPEADLTDPAAIERAWRRAPPELIIHCAALSKAVACEADPEQARAVNVVATSHLARMAAEIPFIFVSTDQVFDGSRSWYRETDPVSPLTFYGRSKAEAERIVLSNPRHTVVRTSLNAGLSPTGDRSFLEETLAVWRKGAPLRLFTDEFRCPIPASVTARAIWELAAQSATGLFHLAGSERLSRWEIGQLLAANYPELHPRCVPGTLREYTGPPRSPDLSLDCARLQRRLSFPLPGFRAWLQAHPPRGSDTAWGPTPP